MELYSTRLGNFIIVIWILPSRWSSESGRCDFLNYMLRISSARPIRHRNLVLKNRLILSILDCRYQPAATLGLLAARIKKESQYGFCIVLRPGPPKAR